LLLFLPLFFLFLIIKYPGLIVIKGDKGIGFKFWVQLIFIPVLIIIGLFLDFNPFLTMVALISIPLYFVAKKYNGKILWVVILVAPFSPDLADGLASLLWCSLLFLSFKFLKKISNSDIIIFLFILSLVPQSFSSFSPIFFSSS